MAEYKTFSFYLKKYWPYFLIYLFSLISFAIILFLAFYYLQWHSDLFSNLSLGILRYDIMLGPILIGDLMDLWKLVYISASILVINTIAIILFKFIDDFYSINLVIYTFILEAFLTLAFYILIIINLK